MSIPGGPQDPSNPQDHWSAPQPESVGFGASDGSVLPAAAIVVVDLASDADVQVAVQVRTDAADLPVRMVAR